MHTSALWLPDLPYFTGDPVFQPWSPASRNEAARETESPVFDYRLIQIGRIFKFCDSNLHHAPWCDEHKSFVQRTLWESQQQEPGAKCTGDCSIHFKSNSENILRSAYFCRNSTLFWTTVFNYIGPVHCGSRRNLAS